MAFDLQATINQVPTDIGPVIITLTDTAEGQFAKFKVDVLDQDGSVMGAKSGNLVPHLTAGQISTANAFMSAMRTKVENEILP